MQKYQALLKIYVDIFYRHTYLSSIPMSKGIAKFSYLIVYALTC